MGKSRDAFCWRINNRIAWLQSSASLAEGLYSIWFGRGSVMPTVGCRGDLDWLKLGEGLHELPLCFTYVTARSVLTFPVPTTGFVGYLCDRSFL